MKLRVAIFGSFHRGEQLARALLAFQEEHRELVEFCGIATDDPFHPRTSPQKRVWQYVDDAEKKARVEAIVSLASEHTIPVWQGSVKTDEFKEKFKEWNTDIVYMGTFGQRVPAHIFNQPIHGFLNYHPTVDHYEWPSYVGGNPFKEMLDRGERHGALALHEVNEEFDNGALVAFSGNFPIYSHDDVVSLHRRTAIEAGKMMEWHLRKLFELPQPRYAIRPFTKDLRPVAKIA
jgi:methionyl-tRNA formyltransferase